VRRSLTIWKAKTPAAGHRPALHWSRSLVVITIIGLIMGAGGPAGAELSW